LIGIKRVDFKAVSHGRLLEMTAADADVEHARPR
jgi:hypothetical protein